MGHDLLIAVAVLGSMGLVILIGRWWADLIWMAIAGPWIVILLAATFVILRQMLIVLIDKPSLSLLGALAFTALIVRPAVDFLTWLYDLSPIEFFRGWPFVEFEPWPDYVDRLKTLPPLLEWDYFRIRKRTEQELDFEVKRDFVTDN